MIVHVTAAFHERTDLFIAGKTEYRSASKEVDIPQVPPVGSWLHIDELNDEYKVTENHFGLDGTAGIAFRVPTREQIDILVDGGWTNE